MDVLRVVDINKNFGGVTAVDGFAMVQANNEITGIIGPNGAGKTTVFNLITGVYPVDSGKIWFCDQDITELSSHRITALGIARTFQNIRLFRNLTVLENLKIAYGIRIRYTLWEEMVRYPTVGRSEREVEDLSKNYLSYFGLEKYAGSFPYNLPYGLQRRLELARALMAGPKLLLLDEPGAGLNPREIRQLMETILHIQRDNHLSIIVVEHHMELVMAICTTIHVLNFGKKIAQGKPEEIQHNDAVLQAYLGDKV
ncbi:MAG TPA: ABC transporter ATP-binding protein [Thermodesulfobacteriota bacterium]|nr:ABC transporter ATP-binding protein [Thermodesulfobacteriota bacterium]